MKKVFCMAAAMVLLLAVTASAHKVSVVAFEESGKLAGETLFGDGRPAVGAEIEITDADGKVIATTKTDDKGSFLIDMPSGPLPWVVELKAGLGHGDSYKLGPEDLPSLAEKAEQAPVAAMEQAPQAQAAPSQATAQAVAPAAAPAGLQQGQQQILAEVKSLKRKVAVMEANLPGRMNQIIGGIGWILGLAGVAFFFSARRSGR